MQEQRNERKTRKKLPKGITRRESGAYRAQVSDGNGNRERRTFSTLEQAVTWRDERLLAVRKGEHRPEAALTVRQAWEEWYAGATASPPLIQSNRERPYAPSVLRTYKHYMERHVPPEIGGRRMRDVRRGHLVALRNRFRGEGMTPGTIHNCFMPLRALWRHEEEQERVAGNPTKGLSLGSISKGTRERAASPEEAAQLLAVLPEDVRAVYAAAFYGGLRRGELRGLRWEDVDLANRRLHVRRSMDEVAGAVEPKSEAGRRTVPINGLLYDELAARKAVARARDTDYVFPGREPDQPFTSTNVRRKALAAWAAENRRREEEAAEEGTSASLLEPIGLHECRHTFVSLMHAAGVPLERIGDYVGHSSTWMTDRYRHLIQGQEAEDAAALDAYLARADTAGRLEALRPEE
jgi:integrase